MLIGSDQDALLGSRQLGMMLRLSSLVGGLAGSITSFFSEGLRKTGSNYPDVEYCQLPPSVVEEPAEL